MMRLPVAEMAPLKSPTWVSTQVAPGFHEAHKALLNELPSDVATHHWPPCR